MLGNMGPRNGWIWENIHPLYIKLHNGVQPFFSASLARFKSFPRRRRSPREKQDMLDLFFPLNQAFSYTPGKGQRKFRGKLFQGAPMDPACQETNL